MFSMIITIIAIALVVALTIATLLYANNTAGEASSRSAAARALNEGNQIVGAMELYRADKGTFPTGTNEAIKAEILATNYLAAWPQGQWDLTTGYAIRSDLTQEVCLATNKKLGINEIPSCSEATYLARTVCCTNP
jgi:hypothetical protein